MSHLHGVAFVGMHLQPLSLGEEKGWERKEGGEGGSEMQPVEGGVAACDLRAAAAGGAHAAAQTTRTCNRVIRAHVHQEAVRGGGST